MKNNIPPNNLWWHALARPQPQVAHLITGTGNARYWQSPTLKLGAFVDPMSPDWDAMLAHGLVAIRSHSTLVERAAPLDPTWLPFLCTAQRAFAAVSRARTMSEADHAAWADIDANIETILTDPDARYREVFTLFVGQKA